MPQNESTWASTTAKYTVSSGTFAIDLGSVTKPKNDTPRPARPANVTFDRTGLTSAQVAAMTRYVDAMYSLRAREYENAEFEWSTGKTYGLYDQRYIDQVKRNIESYGETARKLVPSCDARIYDEPRRS